MKILIGLIAVVFFYPVISSAMPRYHVSSMNEDFQINSSLYRALKEGYRKVPGIQVSGSEYFIDFNNDKLSCSESNCRLVWASKSSTSPSDSAQFQTTLYDTLLLWAQNGGKDEPILHFVTYTQTGSIQITLSEQNLNGDRVQCSIINPRTSMPLKECSLKVSEISIGTDDEIKTVYESLLNVKSSFNEQKNALRDSVKSNRFLPADQHQLGNGHYQVVHTVYTDMLMDGLAASAFYGYKVPVRNSGGRVISNGIQLTITGTLQEAAKVAAQEIQVQPYALAHRNAPPVTRSFKFKFASPSALDCSKKNRGDNKREAQPFVGRYLLPEQKGAYQSGQRIGGVSEEADNCRLF